MSKGRVLVSYALLSEFFKPDAEIVGVTGFDNVRQLLEVEVMGPEVPTSMVESSPRLEATITQSRRRVSFALAEDSRGAELSIAKPAR